jgi:hypothetical protein
MQGLLEAAQRGLRVAVGSFTDSFFLAPTKPFELLFSLLLLVSAIAVLNPTYDIYGSSKTFTYIQWLPEAWFGAILLFVALMNLMAVSLNLHKQRVLASGAECFLFSVMFVLFFTANPTGMLIPWIGVVGLTNLVVFARILNERHGLA